MEAAPEHHDVVPLVVRDGVALRRQLDDDVRAARSSRRSRSRTSRGPCGTPPRCAFTSAPRSSCASACRRFVVGPVAGTSSPTAPWPRSLELALARCSRMRTRNGGEPGTVFADAGAAATSPTQTASSTARPSRPAAEAQRDRSMMRTRFCRKWAAGRSENRRRRPRAGRGGSCTRPLPRRASSPRDYVSRRVATPRPCRRMCPESAQRRAGRRPLWALDFAVAACRSTRSSTLLRGRPVRRRAVGAAPRRPALDRLIQS